MPLTGVFAGPIIGLKYQTPSCSGFTNEKGEFLYREAERVAFFVGDTAIGSANAAPLVNLAQIVSRVDGNIQKLLDPALTNIARFLCTLDVDGDLDGGIVIAPGVHKVLAGRKINFRHDVSFVGPPGDPVRDFEEDPEIAEMLQTLSASGVFSDCFPRKLLSAAAARNEVRRNILGIMRFRDVKIPLQNGLYVYADVFRPAREGKFPVVMNCGVYGRAFHHHSICSEEQFNAHEEMEEQYFQGNSSGLIFENHETVNTADWVPNDYVVMRVDGPGTGKNPGKLAPWGFETAEAYRDAIEWAGEQPWSNGNVGLWGMSYYAINQHAAASLEPSHLKAMIAIGTDVDLYEELMYTGGIWNDEFFRFWYRGAVLPAVCGTREEVDFLAIGEGAPFKDSNISAIFGPASEVFMSPDMSKVKVPLWAVATTTHLAHFHQLGSSEAYLTTRTANKKIDFWEDWFTKSYSKAVLADHMAFFDHWLKGIKNGIMDKPPVRLEIRTGDGSSYLQEENEWPIARTNYTKWYFDATRSDWKGDEHRSDFLRLSPSEPDSERHAEYSAEIPSESRSGPAPIVLPVAPASALALWKTGISFISDPVSEEMVFAGYSMAKLWVSSTSTDMDIFVSLRIVDEMDRLVDYIGMATMGINAKHYPLAKGWLKVSHRKPDEARSSEYTVKHTHLKADYAPLKDGEVVPVEIEIIPNTALIRQGCRIRVDIQPYDGFAHGTRHSYDPSYHDGARNLLYTGPDHLSYIQLPIVPKPLR
jgi:predicted acyl esterase